MRRLKATAERKYLKYGLAVGYLAVSEGYNGGYLSLA